MRKNFHQMKRRSMGDRIHNTAIISTIRKKMRENDDTLPGFATMIEETESYPQEITINCIPVELLRIIFSFLPIHEIATLNRVCTHWYQVLQDEYLWRSLFEMHFGSPAIFSMDWRRRCILVNRKARTLYNDCGLQDRLLWALMSGYGEYYKNTILGLSKDQMALNREAIIDSCCLAASEGQLSIIVSLMTLKIIDINLRNALGDTMLHCSARCGRSNVARYLLSQNVNVDTVNNNKNTPLALASKSGHISTVQLLLSKGANPNSKNEFGNSPLFFAAINGHSQVVKTLLMNNSKVNITNSEGNVPLIFASDKGHLSVVTQLVIHGANVNAQNSDRDTALMFASMNGHIDIVTSLLYNGADANQTNNLGNTALLYASMSGRAHVCKQLLLHGANVNAQGEHGSSALSIACSKGYGEVVSVLLEHDANVNLTDWYRNTPLFFACMSGHREIVNLLLATPDINVDVVNIYNRTAWDIAVHRRHSNIVTSINEWRRTRQLESEIE